MKLDKIKFAHLINYIAGLQPQEFIDIEHIDDLIDIQIPEPVQSHANIADVDRLMALMAAGNQKIEAIKTYRTMTGQGLKESKDAVEKYWPSVPTYTKQQMLNKEAMASLTPEEGGIIEKFIQANFEH